MRLVILTFVCLVAGCSSTSSTIINSGNADTLNELLSQKPKALEIENINFEVHNQGEEVLYCLDTEESILFLQNKYTTIRFLKEQSNYIKQLENAIELMDRSNAILEDF